MVSGSDCFRTPGRVRDIFMTPVSQAAELFDLRSNERHQWQI